MGKFDELKRVKRSFHIQNNGLCNCHFLKKADYSLQFLVFQLNITRTVILSLLNFCVACSSIQANNSLPIKALTQIVTDTSTVAALGKLIPEGDVIRISVVNAQDSRVNQILVQEGDYVKANQVIAILQGQNLAEQELRDAQVNVRIKRSQLLKIQQGDAKAGEIAAQGDTITELQARLRTEAMQRKAAIAEAIALLDNAKLKYQRYMALANNGAITRSDLDDAHAEYKKALAILNQNQAALANTNATLSAQIAKERSNFRRLQEVRPVDVQIGKAELEQALIQIEQKKAELEDKQVRVPVAGQILKINTRVGEQVNIQQGIAELGQTRQMYVIAEVYETDISKLKLGQKAVIMSEYGGFTDKVQGKVTHIGLQIGKTRLEQDENKPTTDVNNRVVEVEIRLDPKDSRKVAALTGMRVRVKINTPLTGDRSGVS
jgi:HlyD family secretion protein